LTPSPRTAHLALRRFRENGAVLIVHDQRHAPRSWTRHRGQEACLCSRLELHPETTLIASFNISRQLYETTSHTTLRSLECHLSANPQYLLASQCSAYVRSIQLLVSLSLFSPRSASFCRGFHHSAFPRSHANRLKGAGSRWFLYMMGQYEGEVRRLRILENVAARARPTGTRGRDGIVSRILK